MDNARRVIAEVGAEYGKLTGRGYGHVEEYRLDDAEVAILALGSTCGTAKVAADNMRRRGVKAGVIKLRTFRPLPGEELAELIGRVGTVAVMDRSVSFGLRGGPLFNEVRSFAAANGGGRMVSYVYGLGGRDINVSDLEGIFEELARIKAPGDVGEVFRYCGLRE